MNKRPEPPKDHPLMMPFGSHAWIALWVGILVMWILDIPSWWQVAIWGTTWFIWWVVCVVVWWVTIVKPTRKEAKRDA